MKKKFFAVLLLVSAIASQSANAAYVADKKPDSNRMTISGTVEQAKINRLLNVIVVKDGYDMNTYPNGVLYSAVIDTDKDGAFNHELTLNMDSVSENEHNFKLYISAYGSNETSEEAFTYYTASAIKEVLSKIASDTTADEVKADIEGNLELLNITTDWFLSLSESDKAVIYGEIAKETEFGTVSDFENSFYSCVLARVLANTEAADVTEKAFTEISKYTGISKLSIYELFENLSDKSGFYKRICKADVKNNNDICNVFTIQTVLAALEKTQNANDVKNLLISGGSIFEEDYKKIEQCKYPGSVYTELIGKSFADISSFRQNVTEFINKYGTGSSDNGGNGGNGGASGNGGNKNNGVTTSANVVSGNNNLNSDIFSDLNEAEWAKDSIKAMYEKKVVSGYPDGSFKPNNPITREEFISLIVSAYAIQNSGSADFNDVAAGVWYEKAVNAAAAAGIVSGIEENTFGVGRNITREEAVAIIERIADKYQIALDEKESVSFSDFDSIAEFAKTAALRLGGAKVVSGYPDGGFHPKDLLTRAQCCVILKIMSEKGANNG